jgi:hypothetical protein
VREKAMLEGGGGDDGEDLEDNEAGGDGRGIEGLVGTPLPGDEILEVVPVCAPWNALGRVKYKAKMQPGQVKKGKAVKEIVERWKIAASAGGGGGKKGAGNVDEKAEDVERMWPREVELIKGLKVEEAFNVVPVGKVTVMMSGGTAGGKGGGGGGKGGGKGKGGKKK